MRARETRIVQAPLFGLTIVKDAKEEREGEW